MQRQKSGHLPHLSLSEKKKSVSRTAAYEATLEHSKVCENQSLDDFVGHAYKPTH